MFPDPSFRWCLDLRAASLVTTRLTTDAAMQWDLMVNGTEIGQLLPSQTTAIIEQRSSVSVTSDQRNRMNVIGTVFPFGAQSTGQDGERGQPVTDAMQQSVKIEVKVRAL